MRIKVILFVLCVLCLIVATVGASPAPFVSPVPWCEKGRVTQPCLPWRPTPGISPITDEAHETLAVNREEPRQVEIEQPIVNVELAKRGACIAAARAWGVDEARCK